MTKRTQMEKARFLRKVETDVEKILWEELRGNKLEVKFRRQHPLDEFVLDFYCPKYKLAIELDGTQHLTKDGKEYDKMRTNYLESKGYKSSTIFEFGN
jgi:very-short-patch-repair endonuclease